MECRISVLSAEGVATPLVKLDATINSSFHISGPSLSRKSAPALLIDTPVRHFHPDSEFSDHPYNFLSVRFSEPGAFCWIVYIASVTLLSNISRIEW
jgi:hypothetical protein